MTKNKVFSGVATWLSPTSEASSSTPARNAYDQVTNLYQLHGRQLVGHLTAIYGNAEDAAEAAQETYYRLYDLLSAGHVIDEPRVWIYRVSRNLMLDGLQRQKNERAKAQQFALESPSMDTTNAETLLVDRARVLERQALLRTALATLTEVEKQCVLARGEGLDLRQIASIVGLSTKYVSDVICRAIEKMQRTIGG